MMGLDTSPSFIIAAAVVLPVLDAIAVLLRFHTRRIQRVAIGTDDWLTVLATILTFGLGICLVMGVHYKAFGYPYPLPPQGKDPDAFTSPETTWARKLQTAFQLAQVLALGLVKTSLVSFYRRIFCSKRTATAFNLISKIWTAILVLWTTSFFFGLLFSCGLNFNAQWTKTHDQLGYCSHPILLEEGFVISDFITDIITLIMPIPMIWRLQLRLARKLAVTGVFLLGALAVAASITRMVIYVKAAYQILYELAAIDADLLVTRTLYWSMIESGISLIACCLPTLRFLFREMSIDKLQQSIRSMLSLSSIRSHDRIPDTLNSDRYVKYSNSTASHTPFAVDAEPRVESHAMRNLDVEAGSTVQPGEIYVQNTMSHTRGIADHQSAGGGNLSDHGKDKVHQSAYRLG